MPSKVASRENVAKARETKAKSKKSSEIVISKRKKAEPEENIIEEKQIEEMVEEPEEIFESEEEEIKEVKKPVRKTPVRKRVTKVGAEIEIKERIKKKVDKKIEKKMKKMKEDTEKQRLKEELAALRGQMNSLKTEKQIDTLETKMQTKLDDVGGELKRIEKLYISGQSNTLDKPNLYNFEKL